jgi:hypothetical protein
MRSDTNSEKFSPGAAFAKQQDRTAAQGQRSSPVIQGMLGNALQRHRAGQLTEAARIYRQILAIDPYQTDSLICSG